MHVKNAITHAHTHAHAHARTHARTHTRTHAHTHTQLGSGMDRIEELTKAWLKLAIWI